MSHQQAMYAYFVLAVFGAFLYHFKYILKSDANKQKHEQIEINPPGCLIIAWAFVSTTTEMTVTHSIQLAV